MLDFTIVKRQVILEYLNIYGTDREYWSIKDCLDVFRYFYQAYKICIGQDHPKLSNEAINTIICNLPQASENIPLKPTDYPYLINKYFQQNFENCDYSMAHFMSGKIRELRCYETLY